MIVDEGLDGSFLLIILKISLLPELFNTEYLGEFQFGKDVVESSVEIS